MMHMWTTEKAHSQVCRILPSSEKTGEERNNCCVNELSRCIRTDLGHSIHTSSKWFLWVLNRWQVLVFFLHFWKRIRCKSFEIGSQTSVKTTNVGWDSWFHKLPDFTRFDKILFWNFLFSKVILKRNNNTKEKNKYPASGKELRSGNLSLGPESAFSKEHDLGLRFELSKLLFSRSMKSI